MAGINKFWMMISVAFCSVISLFCAAQVFFTIIRNCKRRKAAGGGSGDPAVAVAPAVERVEAELAPLEVDLELMIICGPTRALFTIQEEGSREDTSSEASESRQKSSSNLQSRSGSCSSGTPPPFPAPLSSPP